VPLPVTIPQYVDASLDLSTAAGWDLARAEPGPFWSPTTPAELEAALWPEVRQRAGAIGQLL
jgi:hypothetical protein